MPAEVLLDLEEYRDRVHACWLGKSIGGTLGGPHECKTEVLDLDFYRPVPTEPAANDDLDLQLVWLAMLERTGLPPRLAHLAEWWLERLSSYPWNEYGFCTKNLNRGLRPPVSGCFENYYVDEMGSPIRSEIWACLAPADPDLAASLAWVDSALDHAGGEGAWGEMFWAAVQSAAFVEREARKLLRIGLNVIPVHSQISRAVREVVWCHQNGLSWAEARQRVVNGFVFGDGTPPRGGPRPCHAAVNHGFTVIGWLYGEDFGGKLCGAVNCAFDTDCTGATLGALLGILGGTEGIPGKWLEPVGESIVLHKFTRLPEAPRTIGELTERTAALARQAPEKMAARFAFGGKAAMPENLDSLLMQNEKALAAARRDPQSAAADDVEPAITLHYGGEPVIHPGLAKTVGVSLNDGEEPPGDVKLAVPPGWTVEPAPPLFGRRRFTLTAAEVADRNRIKVTARTDGGESGAEFVLLGPGEARGFPAVDNVPKCRKCGAWEGACVCARS